jgi:hypothetical protein
LLQINSNSRGNYLLEKRVAAPNPVAARAGRKVVVAALALGAFAVSTAPAQAAPKKYYPEIVAKGTNGYTITVGGFAGVNLAATKGKPGKKFYAANYSVRGGKSAPKHLRARFGRFGRVNMRFVPQGKPREKLPRGCKGKPDVIQPGVWEGVLRFKGQGGFTKLNVRSASGTVTRFGAYSCKERSSAAKDFVVLWAERKRKGTVTRFDVMKRDRPNARPTFSATQTFRVGKVRIALTTVYRGHPGEFLYNAPHPGGDADVSPKGPFSGLAEYRARDWSGDLTATLPGKKRGVPLTGPGFTAELNLLNI